MANLVKVAHQQLDAGGRPSVIRWSRAAATSSSSARRRVRRALGAHPPRAHTILVDAHGYSWTS
uniref:Uncharacterized protein n=1 Tax=Oryza punctata TaxID=4537 RepID=A0A0E0MEW4_ORYPU